MSGIRGHIHIFSWFGLWFFLAVCEGDGGADERDVLAPDGAGRKRRRREYNARHADTDKEINMRR